jgi:hypothetical protein
MSYQDRIQKPYWLSPNGIRFYLKTKEYSESFDIHAIDIDNLGDGASREVCGPQPEQYPITTIFFGENHDTEAEKFKKELKEKGTSFLQLPYGELKFVTVLNVKMTYNTTEDTNTTRVKVTFIEDTQIVNDTDKVNSLFSIFGKIQDASGSLSGDFANGVKVVSAGEKNGLVNSFSSGLAKMNQSLKPLVSGTMEAVSKFTNTVTNITSNVQDIVNTPLLLANQVMRLKEIPATIIGAYTETKNAYKSLFENTLPDFLSLGGFLNREKKNEVYTNALFSGGALLGMSEAFLNTNFEVKGDAINAVEILQESLESYREFLDHSQKTFEESGQLDKQYIVNFETLQKIQDAVTEVSGSLVQISQNLKREFEFEVSSDTTILNIAKEYYPEELKKGNGILDKIIKENRLKNDEILLIPQGRMIKVYI